MSVDSIKTDCTNNIAYWTVQSSCCTSQNISNSFYVTYMYEL